MLKVLKYLYELGKAVLKLKETSEQHTAAIKQLQTDVKELDTLMRSVAHQFELLNVNVEHEREKNRLEMENFLLRLRTELRSEKLLQAKKGKRALKAKTDDDDPPPGDST